MAAEVFRIESPIQVEDKTDPGVSNAKKNISAFDKSAQKTQERLDKMNRTKYQVALEALDKASSVVTRLGTSLKTTPAKRCVSPPASSTRPRHPSGG